MTSTPSQVQHIQYRWLTQDVLEVSVLSLDLFKSIQAGQYINLSWDSQHITTSIANLPSASDQPFRCLLRDAPLIQQLIQAIDNNTVFQIHGPFGEGTPPCHGHLLCLTGGTGITPFLSWLDHWQQHPQKHPEQVSIVWGVNQESDWRMSPPSCPNFVKLQSLIRPDNPVTWLSEHRITTYNRFYLCGPYRMVQDTYQQLKALGITRQMVYSDMPIND